MQITKREEKEYEKFLSQVKSKANELAIRVKTTMECRKAEGFVDTAVKIIIAVVVGAVILAGLYALFDNVILPRLNTEIEGMFDYTA